MIKFDNEKKQILIVDDDPSLTCMLRALLETRNYHVTVAETGRQALKKVSGTTDLVLLDVVLPDQDGFQVCRKLKEKAKTCNTAIIFLSGGRNRKRDVVEGLYLGADDYIVKPFEHEELIARMEAVMRRSSNVVNHTNTTSNGERDIIVELRKIIDGELITPYFQPIFLLNPFKLYGFECLSRPQTDSFLQSPDVLFKAALQYGFYQELELIAWKKSLEYASSRLNGRKLFLNCNPYLIEGAKFSEIKTLFKKNSIKSEDVFLEITERSAISNLRAFYKDLSVYRNHGFKFAVDDVGGGYASLESIVETKPEVVKIDGNIVNELNNDTLRHSIVKFLVSLCKERGILLVAEGIETKEAYDAVRDLGIDAGQGYYFCRPSPEIQSDGEIMGNVGLL